MELEKDFIGFSATHLETALLLGSEGSTNFLHQMASERFLWGLASQKSRLMDRRAELLKFGTSEIKI